MGADDLLPSPGGGGTGGAEVRLLSLRDAGAGAEKRLLKAFLSTGFCEGVVVSLGMEPISAFAAGGASLEEVSGGSIRETGIVGGASGIENRTPSEGADLDVFKLDFREDRCNWRAETRFEFDLIEERLDCGAEERGVSTEEPD